MPLRPEVLKSWPPQGWIYFQPQTNWHAPTPLQVTFEQQVNNIIAMRKKNPQFKLATDYMTAARDLERYTEKRLNHHQKFCIGEAVVAAQKKTLPPLSPSRLLRGLAHAASNLAGVDPGALEEWFGSGRRPVENELAEKRAAICASCPANSHDKSSWSDWLTAPVAAMFQRYMGIKHSMNLATSKDPVLGKCLACRCELQLKVHAPLDHIRSNLDPIVVARLQQYPHCWVLTE